MKTIAIIVSDLHIQEKPPVARSNEPDWFNVYRRHWHPIRMRALEEDIPILVCGDIFDRPMASPKEINMALELFSDLEVFAIPGQHDLPNHQYNLRWDSAYGVLMRCGAINDVQTQAQNPIIELETGGQVHIFGMPWNRSERFPKFKTTNLKWNILIAHYCIAPKGDTNSRSFADTNASAIQKKYKDFDVMFFGDNHTSFMLHNNNTLVNCGAFIPRSITDKDHDCAWYTLEYDVDGLHVNKHIQDHSHDIWIEPRKETKVVFKRPKTSVSEFLSMLHGEKLSFTDALKNYIEAHDPNANVVDAIHECIENAKDI